MSKLIKIRMWVCERDKQYQSFVLSFMEIFSDVLLKLLSVQFSLQFLKDKYHLSLKDLNNFSPQFLRFNLIFKKLSFSNTH